MDLQGGTLSALFMKHRRARGRTNDRSNQTSSAPSAGGLIGSQLDMAVDSARAAAKSANAWVKDLDPPSLKPSAKVPGRIWNALSALTSVCIWIVTGAVKNHLPIRNPTKPIIGSWFAQLAVNLAWSGAFLTFPRCWRRPVCYWEPVDHAGGLPGLDGQGRALRSLAVRALLLHG